jgi:hypothetical protein
MHGLPHKCPVMIHKFMNMLSEVKAGPTPVQGTPRGAIPTAFDHLAHLWALARKCVFYRIIQTTLATTKNNKHNDLRADIALSPISKKISSHNRSTPAQKSSHKPFGITQMAFRFP